MTALDMVKDIRSHLGSRPVLTSVHPFPFEHAEEALGRRIVGAAPHRTHATDNALRHEELLVFL
jgi:hypothetical protein